MFSLISCWTDNGWRRATTSSKHAEWMISFKGVLVRTHRERKVLCNHIDGPYYTHGNMSDFDTYRTPPQLNTRLRELINLEGVHWKLHLLTERCKSQHRQQARLCLTSLAFLAVSTGRAPFRRPFFFLQLLNIVGLFRCWIEPPDTIVCSHLWAFTVAELAPSDNGWNGLATLLGIG